MSLKKLNKWLEVKLMAFMEDYWAVAVLILFVVIAIIIVTVEVII